MSALLTNARYISRLVCSFFLIRELVAIFREDLSTIPALSPPSMALVVASSVSLLEIDDSMASATLTATDPAAVSDCARELMESFVLDVRNFAVAIGVGPGRRPAEFFGLSDNLWVGTPIGADILPSESTI